ncbi:hypothetical protein BKP37_10070 [Anaerobacillus alkalilacustris]|uniref:Periplasmic binding protein domain-containing protein n=1 Tax=Anaerobacillus alkalilacustris TaxID=393763 RepID=A0A1S2LM58_9BACI|nr:sugar ABC transporter substrate-binding protein [Anaerobacillus alkalilacustris]OIJ13618.1 hypothetical protein BKP37_10070 [Anaerobacillus alkalilacustris]
MKTLVILFITIGSLVGFGWKASIDERLEVTLILKDLAPAYWQLVEAGAKRGFGEFGIDGKVVGHPSGVSAEGELRLLEKVLKESPDIVIISPIHQDSIIPYLERFVEKDIPVILLDTDIPWEGKTTYVGTDNFTLGKLAGALLGSQLQPGNAVAIIGVDHNNSVSSNRIKGAKLSLEAVGIEVVAEVTDLSNEPSKVKSAVVRIINEHPEVKGIIATDDGIALNAFQAINKKGVNIPIIGADGINEMIELIEEGILPGTVAQNPFDMGYKSVETALHILEGEAIERTIDSGVDIIIKGNAKERLAFQKRLLR